MLILTRGKGFIIADYIRHWKPVIRGDALTSNQAISGATIVSAHLIQETQ